MYMIICKFNLIIKLNFNDLIIIKILLLEMQKINPQYSSVLLNFN